ncbi:hypothetical protein CEXT_571171 [Caerostris extrusa]|uniref:Uncharacterized protein n=1 Tax=Caerostris extrusa TaxID=172846 RepID=A0AAV4RT35_CAEEX|nr:hypothetical protein CEXT_571171 [Caerostris extrusa]
MRRILQMIKNGDDITDDKRCPPIGDERFADDKGCTGDKVWKRDIIGDKKDFQMIKDGEDIADYKEWGTLQIINRCSPIGDERFAYDKMIKNMEDIADDKKYGKDIVDDKRCPDDKGWGGYCR